MMGMRGIRVGVWGIGGGNKGNNGENLRIGVEMMNKKYGEAKIKRKCVHLQKYSFETLVSKTIKGRLMQI